MNSKLILADKMIELTNQETIIQAIRDLLTSNREYLFFPIGEKFTALATTNGSDMARMYREKYPFPLHLFVTYDDDRYVVFYSVSKPN